MLRSIAVFLPEREDKKSGTDAHNKQKKTEDFVVGGQVSDVNNHSKDLDTEPNNVH